jgi:hypothetical protein
MDNKGNWFTKYFWRTDKSTNNTECLIALGVFVVIGIIALVAHLL